MQFPAESRALACEQIEAIVTLYLPVPLPMALRLEIVMGSMTGWEGPSPRWSMRTVVTLRFRQRAAKVWVRRETVEDEQ